MSATREQTIAYYAVEGPVRTCLRATSLLERTNRELRRNFRQAVTFGSPTGAEAAIYLQVQRLHACWSDESWWEVSLSLLFAL